MDVLQDRKSSREGSHTATQERVYGCSATGRPEEDDVPTGKNTKGCMRRSKIFLADNRIIMGIKPIFQWRSQGVAPHLERNFF